VAVGDLSLEDERRQGTRESQKKPAAAELQWGGERHEGKGRVCSFYMKGNNFNGPTSGWPKNRVLPVPSHRAEGATQARSDHWAGLARGTILFVPCRVSVVLFRVVLVPVHRA
jgi:hypothetical protein